MKYGYSKKVEMSFAEAEERARAALAEEGFGVLTEIDVQATLKQKLDADFPPYVILGACNPSFAHQALLEEKEIGLLLPCNVIIYEDDEGVHVSAMLPSAALGIIGNEEVTRVAAEVEKKLIRAIDTLA